MPSIYLQPSDYNTYGLSEKTDRGMITQASALIDAYLYRPEGLIWSPDYLGRPAYMAALSPLYSFKLAADISPGQNVAAQLIGPVDTLQPGDSLLLSKGTANKCEVTYITQTGVNPTTNTVTLARVENAQLANTTVDSGMVIEEQKYAPKSRPIVQMMRTPLMRVVAGVGRYGYGRRGDGANWNMEQFNLLAAVSKFGGPPAWEVFDSLLTGMDQSTGQVWFPAGVMLAYYSEVKIRYVAGYAYVNLPPQIKLATAQIAKALLARPSMGNVKMIKAGDSAVEGFTASALDKDVLKAIEGLRVNLYV